MKSLKKTLSLVLVLVMVLGMFGIASAASFPDDASIQYKVPVGVLTSMGAINGFPDGTFGPTKTITRAEASKIVAYAILGPEVAASLVGVSTSFSDMDAPAYKWAAPYVEFLVKQGVVNGVGGGKFNPAGEITALEIAKMLLCAAGYGALDEYVGEGWSLAVAVDAQKQGITTGRAANATALDKPATREEASLYVYNAITRIVQVEHNALLGYMPKGVNIITGGVGSTIAEDVYDFVGMATDATTPGVATYQIEAVAKDKIPTSDTFGKLLATAVNTTTPGDTYSFVVDSYDVVGHIVNLYVDIDDYVFYAHVRTSEAITPLTGGALNTALINKTYGAGAAAANYPHWANYAKQGSSTTLAIGATMIVAPDGLVAANGKDGCADIVGWKAMTFNTSVVTAYTAPTATTTGSIAIAGLGTISIPRTSDTTTVFNYDIYAAPAANDVVNILVADGITYITKADVAAGKVSSVNTANGIVTASSGTYTTALKITNSDNPAFADVAAGLIGKDCYFFFGLDGKVVAIMPDSGSVDAGLFYAVYAYTKDVDTGYGVVPTYWVQGVDMTGKEVNYQVNATGTTVNKLYMVKTAFNPTWNTTIATLDDSNGTSYNLENSSVSINKNDVKVASTNDYFASDVAFIYVTGTGAALKATVKTGVQTATAVAYYATKGANNTVKYVIVAGAASTAGDSIIFAPAITGTNPTGYTKANGTGGVAYKQTVFIDGTPTQILTTNTTGSSATGLYTYVTDADGIYTLAEATGASVGAGIVTNVYGNLITIGATEDISAAGAFIVDVPYTVDSLTNGTSDLVQHNTLASLVGGTVVYTTNGEKITGIYYTAAPATVNITINQSNDAANDDAHTAVIDAPYASFAASGAWYTAGGIQVGTGATFTATANGIYTYKVTIGGVEFTKEGTAVSGI